MKTIQDLWREFKGRCYGRNIDRISHVQIRESELVFYSAIAAMLIHLKEEISELPEDKAVEQLERFMKEVTDFYDRAQINYDKLPTHHKL